MLKVVYPMPGACYLYYTLNNYKSDSVQSTLEIKFSLMIQSSNESWVSDTLQQDLKYVPTWSKLRLLTLIHTTKYMQCDVFIGRNNKLKPIHQLTV